MLSVILKIDLILLLVLFVDMLIELATGGIFTLLATAPPHLPAVVALMSSARPVVIFILNELLVAKLADLLVEFDLSYFESLYAFLEQVDL